MQGLSTLRTMMRLYRYNCFAPHITAFSTERGEEVDASAPHSGFNINRWCGDSTAHTDICRATLCHALGIDSSCLVLPHQTHGTVVADVDRGDAIDGADALMTSRRGLCIGVSTADCIPILLHDTRHDAICAVHSGWRGTVQHITARALEAMAATYATRREDVVAAIGPGIRIEAFEVGDEVYEAFSQAGFSMGDIARRMDRRWHIDLVQAVRADLSGVNAISDCGLCTHTMYHRFFSARRLGIDSGRIFTGIMRS